MDIQERNAPYKKRKEKKRKKKRKKKELQNISNYDQAPHIIINTTLKKLFKFDTFANTGN